MEGPAPAAGRRSTVAVSASRSGSSSGGIYRRCSSSSSSSSSGSASSTVTAEKRLRLGVGGDGGAGEAEEGAREMVLRGCPRCFMYVMVQEQKQRCPRCSSAALVRLRLLEERRRREGERPS